MPATTILAAIGVTAASVGATAYAAAVFAINFAVSYTLNRVFGAKPSRVTDNGARQQIPPSADNRLPVVYGEAWMGGTFVDAVMSNDNQAMYYVLAISHISPDGQFTYDTTKFYYGDRLITFAPGTNRVQSLTDGNGNVDTKIDGYLYFNLYTSTAAGAITTVLGTAPNVAMGGVDIPAALRWPATGRQMNGLAFAIVYLKYNTDAGTTGLQPVTFRVKHALNNTGVAKPGSVLKDYLTNTVYGGAIPLANVDTVACADLDTYSDQTITYTPSGGGSATQVRYRINGVLDTGETVLNNIDHILTACDSWLAYQADTGQWSPVVNKAESSSFAFNDSNIIGEIRVSATDINQSINEVEASFPWKDNKDQPGTVYIKTPSALLYPNEPVNKYTTTFNLVNDSVQAQYLANRMLEQAREDLIVSFNTAYTGIQVNAGDVVSVTNTEYGWNNKLFRVIKVNETSLADGNLGARVELNEYNAEVYDDFNITQFTPAPNSLLQSGYFFPALSAVTFSDQQPLGMPPTFSVSCQLPTTTRVTTVTLFYTADPNPGADDWRVYSQQVVQGSNAFAPGEVVKFNNVTVGAGVYYFSFMVSNELASSRLATTSSAFSWSPFQIAGAPTGTLSSRTCYARITGTPTPTDGTITTSGSTSFPSSAQSLSVWGFSATWQATDPDPLSTTQTLYQADGVYNSSTNQTVWSKPYFGTLKVGQLSAVAVRTGTLTVDTNGYVRGGQTDYNTGTGFFLGYSGSAYKFSIGNSTQSLLWDGSSLTIKGNIRGDSTIGIGVGTTPGGYDFEVTTTGVVYSRIGYTQEGFFATSDLVFPPITATAGLNDVCILSQVKVTQTGLNAHAVRGQNLYWGSSGLVGPALNNCDFYAEGHGVYLPFTGAHDALMLPSATVEPGDIVVDVAMIGKASMSQTISEVARSTQANQKAVIGVYVSSMGLLADSRCPSAFGKSFDYSDDGTRIPVENDLYEQYKNTYNLVSVNALGEGQINVCGENGDIEAGDLIVASSIPGKGMKQTDDIVRSYTVARARESATFAPGEVKLIACIYLCG